jgi:tetratricopeptide (TPR) repeat protein
MGALISPAGNEPPTQGGNPGGRRGAEPDVVAPIAALKDAPTDPEAWYRAGKAALRARQIHLATRLFQSCLRLSPSHVKAAAGLCVAHFHDGEYDKAERACRLALESDPTHLQSILMWGHLCRMLGRSEESADQYRKAVSANVSEAEQLKLGLTHLRLASGDWTAWGAFEPGAASEQLRAGSSWTPPAERVWSGEADSSITVCLYRDGGNGDLFFFSRFIPWVAERVDRVYLTATSQHIGLLDRLPGIAGLVASPEELPEAQFAHLWSIPGLAGAGAESMRPPYLATPIRGPELGSRAGLRVGLTWAGHPGTPINHDRSVPSTDLLEPLFNVPGIEWVALQFGHRSEEATSLPFTHRPDVRSYADTAYILSQLDLVISVDTAVANLSGAMAIDAWIMPPTYPELRWGLHGARTPWYPSLRLFRRERTDDWSNLLIRIEQSLREWVVAKAATRR